MPRARYPSTVLQIPGGIAGVRFTLLAMHELQQQGKKNPLVNETALKLTRYLPQKDETGEMAALHEFVRDRIRYVRDVRNVETLRQPDVTLKIGQGDCDDKSVLLASMLGSLGYITRFVALAFPGKSFKHVTTEVLPMRGPKKWITLETTEPVPMNWKPAGVNRALAVVNN